MSKKGERLRGQLDRLAAVNDEAVKNATKAEDVLTTIEDRERRRTARSAVDDPRNRIVSH